MGMQFGSDARIFWRASSVFVVRAHVVAHD